MAIELVLKYWKFVLVAAVLLACAGTITWEHHLANRWHARANTAEAQLARLQLATDMQNQAITTLKQTADALQAQAEAKLKAAQAEAKQVEIRYKTKYVPVPVPKTCEAAIQAGAVNGAALARLYQGAP
jgi:high-affinity K+ transport system ATPase subunit B